MGNRLKCVFMKINTLDILKKNSDDIDQSAPVVYYDFSLNIANSIFSITLQTGFSYNFSKKIHF